MRVWVAAALMVTVACEPASARLLAVLAQRQAAKAAPVATVDHPIARGESLGVILIGYGVPASEVRAWYMAARPVADLRRLAPGRAMTLAFAADQRLVALRYAVDDEREVVVKRVGRTKLRAWSEPRGVTVRVAGVRGTVHSSFHGSAKRAGVPDAIISAVVDWLGWKVDFESGVHPGDRFRVLYEQRLSADGRPLKPGRLLAADFIGQASSAAAFLYENELGQSTYLDMEGRALGGAFLRYPLAFTQISSSFSSSRFHPIFGGWRAHRGVDFAAPAGTPVRAVGPGTVRWAGWKGSFGRHVEIDHGNGLVSAYSHLRGIASGTVPRARVARGQVLGWVGQSGLATGPHLHFALFDHGRYQNPLTFHRTPPLRVDAEEFRRIRGAFAQRLRAVQGLYAPTASTPPVILSAVAQAREQGPVLLTL